MTFLRFTAGILTSMVVLVGGCDYKSEVRSVDERFGTMVDSFISVERVTREEVTKLREFLEENYESEELSYQLSAAFGSVAGCAEDEILNMQRMLCIRLREAYLAAEEKPEDGQPTLPAVLEELSKDYADLRAAIGPIVCSSSQDTIEVQYDWLYPARVMGPHKKYLKVSGMRLDTAGSCLIRLVGADKTVREFTDARFSVADGGKQIVVDLSSIRFRRDDVEMQLTLAPPAKKASGTPPAYAWSLPADAWRLDWKPLTEPRKARITATKIDIYQDGSGGDAEWDLNLSVAVGTAEAYKMVLFKRDRLSDGKGNSANGALYAETCGDPNVYILRTIRDSFAAGDLDAVVGVAILVFSVIGPIVKLGVLSFFVVKRHYAERALNLLLYVNSWSMLEVFVVAWGIAQLKQLPGAPRIRVGPGLVCLTLAIVLSSVASILYKRDTNRESAG